MIASLTGTIDRISLDSVIITVGGVGYRVFATPDTLATFSRGSTATVLTELVVREDSLTLYGFAQPDQQELFLLLQKVSGIGPRMALSILSVLHPRELCAALSHSDTTALQKVPGVGKRVAERLVVELKDKVESISRDEDTTLVATTQSSVAEEVSEALAGLGFSQRETEKAIGAVLREAPDAEAAAVLRQALSHLGGRA